MSAASSSRRRCWATVKTGSSADSRPASKMAKRSAAAPTSTSRAPATWARRRRPAPASSAAPAPVAPRAIHRQRPRPPPLVGLADVAQPALEDLGRHQLDDGPAHRHPPDPARRGPAGDEQHGQGAGAGGGAPGEDERQLVAGVVPGGHGGVGDQDRGVGGHGRGQTRRDHLRRPTRPPGPAGELAGGGGGRRRPEGGEEPGAHAHRRGHLGHPQHVEGARRASEVGHEESPARRHRTRRRQQAPAGEAVVTCHPAGGDQEGGAGGDPPGEEVGRHVPLPHRPLHDRPPVVGADRVAVVGCDHRDRRPAKAATTPTTRVAAAALAARHMEGRSRVVTTGSGGSR